VGVGLFSRVFSRADKPDGHERHNIDKMALWGTGADIGDPSWTGVSVSQESALRLSVVWRCIRLISETCAALPADIVRKVGDVRQVVDRTPRWVEFPNPETSWFEFSERIFESLAMDGNAFVIITARDFQGFPAELWTLDPRQIQVRRRDTTRELYFLWNGQRELSKFGPSTPLGDVLHLKLATAGGNRGLSPLEQARQAVGLGLATEKYGAKYFGGDSQPPGMIEIPDKGPQQTQETVDHIAEMWKARHGGTDKSHNVGILTGGATFNPLSIPNDQAQFLDTRKFQVEEIASRIYGIPPHMVGLTEKQTSWGTGIEQQATGFIRFTLLPWIIRFETAMSQLLPRGQFVHLNQRGLLRADSKTESEVLTQQLLNGVRNANEFRALLDLEPRPGGDRYMVPVNEQILTAGGQAPEKPALVPAPAESPNGNGKVATPDGGAT
jgi:HK97 family phage portal protein